MTKPNILVLGATGKVGGDVVSQLIDTKDVNVIAATRSSKKAQAFKDKGIESVILDLAFLAEAPRYPDRGASG